MRKFISKINRQSGQAMVEAMVALGVLVTGLLGIVTLLNQSLGINRTIANNYTATYLAAEGIEVVKNIIDSNVIDGRQHFHQMPNSGTRTYEVQYDDNSLQNDSSRKLTFSDWNKKYCYSCGGTETPFTRTLTLTRISNGEMRVLSKVAWRDRGGNYQVELEDHFYAWR